MLLIQALEAVCDLLPYFALAALFKAYADPGPIIGTVLLLVFVSAVILKKADHKAVRLLCALLPLPGLFAARTSVQILFTLPALLIWLVIALSGKLGIHYEDYKYWFGIPAVPVLLMLLISVPRLPRYRVTVLCAALYLAAGILVLRRKRMGAGAGSAAKLLNIAEIAGALLCGVLACALGWELLAVSGRFLEMLLYPVGWLIAAFVRLFEWITAILVRMQPPEESAEYTSTAAAGEEVIIPDTEVPNTESAAYAWAETLGHAVLYILLLALFVFLVYLVYRTVSNIRTGAYGGDLRYEDTPGEKTVFGRERRKKRKKTERTNNEKVREIYREYLSYIRLSGVEIARQTTSEDVLTASKQLADSEEAEKLRALYIRARYDDAGQLSEEEVARAGELWKIIREEYEAESRRRREEAACLKQGP